jgi:GNAT superfamily N-acetyltransferase
VSKGTIVKLNARKTQEKTGNRVRSGRHSTREVYRATAVKPETDTPSGTAKRTRLQVLPAILKDKRGMATDYSCRLAPRNIARIKLTERSPGHFWIDWVFVPPAFREYGLGRKLMRKVIADADALGIRVSLEARACAGLSQAKLEAWYGSMGFVKTPFCATFGPILVRMPRRKTKRTRRAA